MRGLSPESNKIWQLLTNNVDQNVLLGLQLLKSTSDINFLTQILLKKYGRATLLWFHLIPKFQEKPKLWKIIKPQIPEYKQRKIERFMNYTILELPNATVDSFCELASKKALEFFPDFPKLSPEILPSKDLNSSCIYRHKKRGVGWSLQISIKLSGLEGDYDGKTWVATAHHPDFWIQICRKEHLNPIFSETWLKKIQPSV